jgi:3-hydroxy-9,10-secoandrosta-1,3,5(10)-triene-9,17-dione monooxygenase
MTETLAASRRAGPSHDELVARAVAWRPALIERSARADELRMIPPENVAELKEKQFHLAGQPIPFGGLTASLDTAAQLAREVGRGCPSTAWMTGQWAGHQFLVGMTQLEFQQEYWSEGPDTLSSTASAIMRINAAAERGGVRITDTMVKFSSGIDYAEWIILTAPVGVCLVPRSDFTIVDDWHVMGLRGTGSKSLVIEDAWVPPHRIIEAEAFRGRQSPGARLYPDVPLYQVPPNLAANFLLLAPLVGMGQGLLDIFEERARSRVDLHTGEKAFERPTTQLKFGESSFEIEVAAKVLEDGMAELVELGRAGHDFTLEDKVRIRRNQTQGARFVLQAGERLLTAGDASGMYDVNRWQRWGRDMKMAGLQASLTPDEIAMSYSRVRWGLPPTSRRI